MRASAKRQLASAVLLIFLIPLARVEAEDIVLGMSAAFTGPSRGLGIELYRGSMAYFEHVNRSGGIHGRKIVLKAYDDGYNPVPALENTIKLIEQDDPLLLYGYVGTPTVTRMLPLLKLYSDRHMYLFFPFTGAQPHRQPPYDQFVFNLRASYHQETAATVQHFLKIGRKRIAVFYQIDAYGRGGWDGVRAALAQENLAIVEEATYHRGTPFSGDLRRQVDILRKADPDVVICVGAYAACAAFIRDARDSDWDVPISNVAFVGTENLLRLLLEHGKAQGKDYTGNLINSQVVPNYHRTELPAVRQYRELMDRYNPMPSPELVQEGYQPFPSCYGSFEGFLDAKLLVEVLKRMGQPLERSRLQRAVESIDHLDLGIDEAVSFGRRKHQGLNRVYFSTVRDGRVVPLEDWKRWGK
jgi:ABC-type branched-subunit amino acid transport system substrate-binding protein